MYLHGVTHSCQHCRHTFLPRTLTSNHTYFCQHWQPTFVTNSQMYSHGVTHSCQHWHYKFLPRTLTCTHTHSCQHWHHIFLSLTLTCTHMLSHILVNTGIIHSCHTLSHGEQESSRHRHRQMSSRRERSRRNVRFKITHPSTHKQDNKEDHTQIKFLFWNNTVLHPLLSRRIMICCNTLQHTAPRCTTLQHTAAHSRRIMMCVFNTRYQRWRICGVHMCMCVYVFVRVCACSLCVYVYMYIYIHIIIHVFQQRYQQRRIYNQIVVLLQSMIKIGYPLIEVQVVVVRLHRDIKGWFKNGGPGPFEDMSDSK